MSECNARKTDWIPVRTASGSELLNLENLLLRASEIVDLDIRDDLSRSATLRFLTAITVLILRRTKYSKRRGDLTRFATEGLPHRAVTSTLNEWDERFDLLHPDRPFMQETRNETALAGPAARLHPKVAGPSDAAWFGAQPRSTRAPALTPADAIMALITHYHHGTANNGGPKLELPNGREKKFAPRPGSPGTRATRRGDVHLWWRGPNLLSTLMMNVKPYWVRGDTTLPDWFNEPDLALEPGSLAEWTHSGLTALLTPQVNNGDVTFSAAQVGGKLHLDLAANTTSAEYSAAIREQMYRTYSADPRRPKVETIDQNGTKTYSPVFGLRPTNTTIQNLAALWTKRGNAAMERGLLPPVSGTDIAVLAIDAKQKTATVKIEGVAWTSIDRGIIDPTPTSSRLLADLAKQASRDVETQIFWAAADVFPAVEGKRSPAADALTERVSLSYYNQTRQLLDAGVAAAIAGTPQSDAMFIEWQAAALSAFDEATELHSGLALMPRIATARARFVRRRQQRRTVDSAIVAATGAVIRRHGEARFTANVARGATDPSHPCTRRALVSALSKLPAVDHEPFIRAAGATIRLPHTTGRTIGKIAAGLREQGSASLDTTINILPQLGRDTAATTMARLLERAGMPVDHFDYAETLCRWDSPAIRRRVVNDYYGSTT